MATTAHPIPEPADLDAFDAHELEARHLAEDYAELQAEMDAAYWEEVWWEELYDPALGY